MLIRFIDWFIKPLGLQTVSSETAIVINIPPEYRTQEMSETIICTIVQVMNEQDKKPTNNVIPLDRYI